jgi:hypothetical protein
MINKNFLLFIIIIYIIIILIIFLIYLYETNDYYKFMRTLENDGYKVFRKFEKKTILKELPKDYEFLNYKYKIKGCSISTFHRDVTSSQSIYNTKYPVYTCITYKNNGNLLAICPSSHKTTPFLFERPLIINGNEGTTILFNCDIVHSGAINEFGDDREAIQFKVCHKVDKNKLKHLIGINKISTGICKNTWIYEYGLRKISLFYPFIINHLFTKLLQTKPDKDSIYDILISKFYIGDFYL